MGPCLSNYSCPVKYEIIDNFLEIEIEMIKRCDASEKRHKATMQQMQESIQVGSRYMHEQQLP